MFQLRDNVDYGGLFASRRGRGEHACLSHVQHQPETLQVWMRGSRDWRAAGELGHWTDVVRERLLPQLYFFFNFDLFFPAAELKVIEKASQLL